MSGALRIGEVARAAGTTVRTIRYYEELGLLATAERAAGAHRLYAPADVELLQQLLRLKELLGLSLEELREVAAAEAARPGLKAEILDAGTPARRRGELLERAAESIARQQALVARRRAELDALDADLSDRLGRVATRREELTARSS